MLEKSKINFTMDSLMLIVMMAIAGIGFLMKFILIPGKERWLVYGTNVELYWLGLDRHEWGTIHLWLGYILLFLLVLHIAFHVKWIINTYTRTIANSVLKNTCAFLFVVLCLVLILFSFFTTPVVENSGDNNHRSLYGHR
jgi:hypothetical protein